jgi:hypothetical protein
MPKYYVTDEIGNKYESMSKDEILASIGAGGEREHVFTGEIMYDKDGDSITDEVIDYAYTGTKPDDSIILKLLEAGLKPVENNLIETEITNIINLSDFTIHYYYKDGELYVSNRADNAIKFFKTGVGVMTLYPRSKEIEYYIKSNEKIENIVWLTSQEYNDIVKKPNVTYIVTDEEALEHIVIPVTYNKLTDTVETSFDIKTLIIGNANNYIVELSVIDNSLNPNEITSVQLLHLTRCLKNYYDGSKPYWVYIFTNEYYSVILNPIKTLIRNYYILAGEHDIPNATNVTTKINGKKITNIFESDGTTAKNATAATNVTDTIAGMEITDIFDIDIIPNLGGSGSIKMSTRVKKATRASFISEPLSLEITGTGAGNKCAIDTPGLYACVVSMGEGDNVLKFTALISIPDLSHSYYSAAYVQNLYSNDSGYGLTHYYVEYYNGFIFNSPDKGVLHDVKLIAEY